MDNVFCFHAVCPDILYGRSSDLTRYAGKIFKSRKSGCSTPVNKISPFHSSTGNYECIRFILVVSYQILYCGMENQSVKIVYEKEIASPSNMQHLIIAEFFRAVYFHQLLDGGIFRKKSGLCRNTEGGVSRNVFIFFKHNIKAKAVCCGYNSVSC